MRDLLEDGSAPLDAIGYVIVREWENDDTTPPVVLVEFGFDSQEEAFERVNSDLVVKGRDPFIPNPNCTCGQCYSNIDLNAAMTIGSVYDVITAMAVMLDQSGDIIFGNALIQSAQNAFRNNPNNN